MTTDFSFEDLDLSPIDSLGDEVTASRAEHDLRLASASVEPLWPYLAAAKSSSDFSQRLAMSEEAIGRAVAPVATLDETLRVALREGLVNRWLTEERARQAQANVDREVALVTTLVSAGLKTAKQTCPSCKQETADWEPTGDTNEDGEPEKALYCSNCDYGIDKVEKHSAKTQAPGTRLKDGDRVWVSMGWPAATLSDGNWVQGPGTMYANEADVRVQRVILDSEIGEGKQFQIISSKTARVEQVVFKAQSHDWEFADGPTSSEVAHVVGKYVRLVCFNDHGVAADHLMGRFAGDPYYSRQGGGGRTPMGGDVVEFLEDGREDTYPLALDDIYTIVRLEEPVEVGQPRLFAAHKSPFLSNLKQADRSTPTIDSAEGYEYTPAPEWVQRACRRRFEGGGPTGVDPKRPGYYLHGIGNFWDGPSEVKDNGDHTLSYTNPYTRETDRFDDTGYFDHDGKHVTAANSIETASDGDGVPDGVTQEHWDLAHADAGLGVGHIWTNTRCPAYRTYDPSDCNCGKEGSKTASDVTLHWKQVIDAGISRDELLANIPAHQMNSGLAYWETKNKGKKATKPTNPDYTRARDLIDKHGVDEAFDHYIGTGGLVDWSNAVDDHQKASAKTAAGAIRWVGDTHMGVGFIAGVSDSDDVYEVYYNPNFKPTPCAWARYGPEGDTGMGSQIERAGGFTTMQEAMKAAEANAAGHKTAGGPGGSPGLQGYKPSGEISYSPCDTCGEPVAFEKWETSPGGFWTTYAVDDGAGSDYLGTWCKNHTPRKYQSSKTAGWDHYRKCNYCNEDIKQVDGVYVHSATGKAESPGKGTKGVAHNAEPQPPPSWEMQMSTSRHTAEWDMRTPAQDAYANGWMRGKRDRETGNDPQGVGFGAPGEAQTPGEQGYWDGYALKPAMGPHTANDWQQRWDEAKKNNDADTMDRLADEENEQSGTRMSKRAYSDPGGDNACYNCSPPGSGKGWRGGICEDCNGTGVDPTPYGTGGDHCPWCGVDWKQPHDMSQPHGNRFGSVSVEALLAGLDDTDDDEVLEAEAAFFKHPTPPNPPGTPAPNTSTAPPSPGNTLRQMNQQEDEERNAQQQSRQRHEQYWQQHPEEAQRHMQQNARHAVNESAYGTERYQKQPAQTGTHWPDAWDDGKAPQSYLDQGRAAHEPDYPWNKDRMTTVRESALKIAEEVKDHAPGNLEGFEQSDDFETTQQPLTTRPRVMPTQHQAPSMSNPPIPMGQAPGEPMMGGGDFTPGEMVDVQSPVMPTVDQMVAAKVARVASRVRMDNPSMSPAEAKQIAAMTVARFPEMVKG